MYIFLSERSSLDIISSRCLDLEVNILCFVLVYLEQDV